MFKPLLSAAKPLPPRQSLVGERAVYWTLAVAVGVNLLLLILVHTDGSWFRSKNPRDITQEVSVTIERVNPATSTIRVVGDLVGIMGTDVIVTPQTWIGIDRQLVAFGELRDGFRADISFVREGGRRVAWWIAASSARPSEETSPGPAAVNPPPAAAADGAATAVPASTRLPAR